MTLPRGSGEIHSPTSKERAWLRRFASDRRIWASGLGVFAALVGLIRSIIDFFNRR